LTAGFFYDIAKRKAMETALKESEKNLIEAQRIARVGNWVRDLSGNFISASAEYCRIFGVVDTECPGTFEALLKLVHPDDRGKIQSGIETLLKTRIPYSVEYRLILADGTERIVHEKGEAAYDAMGETIRLIGTVQEITERKRVEDALRKSEERYALAVDGVNDGIWERDLITGEVYFSPRWKSMLGYEDHEISNNIFEWKKRIHPDDYQTAINANKAYLNGHILPMRLNISSIKDGIYRWIYACGAACGIFTGCLYRMAGSHTDITSRKIADEVHRREEALFKTVLETLPVGVWILEKDGMIALSNEAARKIWAGARYVGIDRYDEYKGWWQDTGERIEKEEWAAVRAIRSGETTLGEIIAIECFDGSRKTISNSAVPLINDKGEIYAAVVVNEDITGLKRAEKSLKESEKKFRTLFEVSKDTIFVSDTARRFLDINQAGIELFGYSKDELLSLNPAMLYCDPKERFGISCRTGS
jgi:PAS domain S-box-containing protein